MRIRSDLVGVVYVEGLVLRAGDTIPEAVTVGNHLIEAADAPEPEAPASAPKPKPHTKA